MIYSTFYARLVPNRALAGTKYSIAVTGVTAVIDGQKTYGSAAMYFAIKPKSSGMATVTFKNDTTGDIIGTKTIMVRSNTLANPTYDLNVSATSVNEGGTITFTVDTSDVPVNTNIPYTITGVSLIDINLPSLTGNFKVGVDGTASLSITIIEDVKLEGTEILTLTLDGKGLSKSVTINDTSNTPIYTGTIFEVGKFTLSSSVIYYGYGKYNNTIFGRELSDDLSYNNVFVGLSNCDFSEIDKGLAAINLNLSDDSYINPNTRFKLKLTNLTNNINFITDEFTYESDNMLMLTPSWGTALSLPNIIKAKQMFIVGQKIQVNLFEVRSGEGTFTVGNYEQSAGVYNTGYINYPNINPKVGIEIKDDLKIDGQLIDISSCYILNVPASNTVSLWFSLQNTSAVLDTMNIFIKLTNMSNGITYTTPILDRIYIDTSPWVGGFGIPINNVNDTATLRNIMTPDTNVKVEVYYTDVNPTKYNGTAAFTIGKYAEVNGTWNYGLGILNDASIVPGSFGQKHNDTIQFGVNKLDIYNCYILDGGTTGGLGWGPGVSLWVDIRNRNYIEDLYILYGEVNVDLSLTMINLNTNEALVISGIKRFTGSAKPYYGWYAMIQDPDFTKPEPPEAAILRRLFTNGQQMRIALTYSVI